ncbi:MAG: VapB-type antitoxin [Thermoproteota archaeon]|jgi:hypothetical protein|nr:VapB-type antitoxin [Thermoproteota archaeon]
MSELIRVTKEVKKKLVKLAAEIQQEKGEKISLNYAIDFLIDFYYNYRRKNPQLLISLFGSVKGLREEFEKSRREDESNNRYGTIG